MELDYFRLIQGTNDVHSEKSARVREYSWELSNNLKSSIHYNENVSVNGVLQPLIVVPTKNHFEYNIETMPGDNFDIGDDIVFEGKHWLVTARKQVDLMQVFGTMTLATQPLRFQTKDCIIHECWAVVGSSYRTNRYAAMFNDAHGDLEFYVRYDDVTRFINLNRRFVTWIGYDEEQNPIPVIYKVADISLASEEFGYGKIAVLEMRRDTYNESDSIEYLVADYVEPPTPSIAGTKPYCQIVGGNVLRANANARTYRAKFIFADGSEATGITPVWSVTIPSGYSSYVDITNEPNGSLTLYINNVAAIGQRIDISLSASESEETEDFTPTSKILEVI